jgi:hypothetical protein
MKSSQVYPLPPGTVPRTVSRSPRGQVRIYFQFEVRLSQIILGTKSNDILELTTEHTWRVIAMGHAEGELRGLSTHPTKACILKSL